MVTAAGPGRPASFKWASNQAMAAPISSGARGSPAGNWKLGPCLPPGTRVKRTSTPAFFSVASINSDCWIGTISSRSPWKSSIGASPALTCAAGDASR